MSAFEKLLQEAVQNGTIPGAVVFAKDKSGKLLLTSFHDNEGSIENYPTDMVYDN